MSKPVLIISGTNRPDANALRIANVLLGHYRAAGVAADLFSLADMPRECFDPGAYAHKSPAIVAMQDRVVASVGLHLVVPEYNGSFPGVLKYFIDMLRFPESFERKPVAFVGEAAGAWGALRSVEQLQLIFGYRNAHIFPERVFIPRVREALDAEGRLVSNELDQRLAAQAKGFAEFAVSLAS